MEILACGFGTTSVEAEYLKVLANQAPDQNGANNMYGDVLNLSDDASWLNDHNGDCQTLQNSFNDDLATLNSDLAAEGEPSVHG
jgi:hypothetical protein